MNTPVYDALTKLLEWTEAEKHYPADIQEAVQVLHDYLNTFNDN